MKSFLQSIKINLILVLSTILLFAVVYPLIICSVGLLFPQQAEGSPVERDGKVIGFKNIGQSFTEAKYFWGRPSAVNYNAISAAPSNLGPTNPTLLDSITSRINTLLKYNPGIKKSDIPIDLVTASGSGIDPDISVQAAYIQIPRIASARGINQNELKKLVDENTGKPFLNLLGPVHVNVLKLNLALDKLAVK
jgi:K+-transporting ATPase ATPase C chain